MFFSRKSWCFVAFVIGLSVAESMASDTTKVDFDGWTVSITPRRPVANSALPDATRLVSSRDKQRTEGPVTRQQGIAIRPVSYQQSEPLPTPEPPPVLEDVPVSEIVQPIQAKRVESPVLSETVTPVVVERPSAAPCTDCGPPLLIPKARPELIKEQPVVPQAINYRDIYFAIPFNRAEYNANPSYRHEATMEILFNQLRPTVIQRSTSNTYQYNYGGGGGYGYPYGNLTYPFYPYGYPYLLLHTY